MASFSKLMSSSGLPRTDQPRLAERAGRNTPQLIGPLQYFRVDGNREGAAHRAAWKLRPKCESSSLQALEVP